MGFTSYDDLISELTAEKRYLRTFCKVQQVSYAANVFSDLWGYVGDPTVGDVSGAALKAVACTESTNGALNHGGNVSTDTKHLLKLGALLGSAGAPAQLLLYDRLLYYPGIDANSAASQTLDNTVTLPRYTTGDGVRAFLEVTTVLAGTKNGNFTFGAKGYTNSVGTTGQQHGVTVTIPASAVPIYQIAHAGVTANQNYNPFLPMAAGDLGIRSAESVQFSQAMGVGGVFNLVLCKPLAMIPLPALNTYTERDMIFQVASLARVYDTACLSFLLWQGAATSTAVFTEGDLEVGWG